MKKPETTNETAIRRMKSAEGSADSLQGGILGALLLCFYAVAFLAFARLAVWLMVGLVADLF